RLSGAQVAQSRRQALRLVGRAPRRPRSPTALPARHPHRQGPRLGRQGRRGHGVRPLGGRGGGGHRRPCHPGGVAGRRAVHLRRVDRVGHPAAHAAIADPGEDRRRGRSRRGAPAQDHRPRRAELAQGRAAHQGARPARHLRLTGVRESGLVGGCFGSLWTRGLQIAGTRCYGNCRAASCDAGFTWNRDPGSAEPMTATAAETVFEPCATVCREGVDLAVFACGDPEAVPVLLIHGWPDTHLLWTEVAARLARDFRVIAFDNRGAGRSSAPAEVAAYRLEELAADVYAVLDAVVPGRKAHVLGHDWGSVLGWEVAADPRAAQRIASFTALSGPNLDFLGAYLRGPLSLARVR